MGARDERDLQQMILAGLMPAGSVRRMMLGSLGDDGGGSDGYDGSAYTSDGGYTDNGDGTFTDQAGNIVDSSGNPIDAGGLDVQTNADGSFQTTDQDGNVSGFDKD